MKHRHFLAALVVLLFPLASFAQSAPETCDPSLANGYVCNTSADPTSIGIGTGSDADASQSVALGDSAMVDTGSLGSVGVGYGVLVGASPDSVAIGNGAQIFGAQESVSVGASTYTQGVQSIAIGYQANTDALANMSVVMGYQAGAVGNASGTVVIGGEAYASGTSTAQAAASVVVGLQAYTTADSTAVYGALAYTDSDSATAIGQQAHAGDPVDFPAGVGVNGNYYGNTVGYQTAIGAESNAIGGQSVALGAQSVVDQGAQFSIALGYGAHAEASNCVSLGSGATCTRANSVEIGYGLQQRVLGGLLPGVLPTDAVNLGQVSPLAFALGGGAEYDSNGSFISPMYVLQNPYTAGDYGTVGDAITALDKAISAVQTTPGAPGPVGPQGPKGDTGPQGPAGPGNATGTDPLAVHYDDSSLSSVTLGRQANANDDQTASEVGSPVIVHNLAPGVAGTDAANVDQVQEALDSANNYTDIKTTQVLNQANAYTDWRVGQLDGRIKRAVAMGTAQAQMVATYAGADPSSANRVAVGTGWEGGYGAMAVGYQHVSVGNQHRVTWNVGASISGGDGSVGGGVGFSW